MNLYELEPAYLCQPKNTTATDAWNSCNRTTFCQDPSIDFKIDWTSHTSLHNWIEEYDMHCSEKVAMGLFGSLYFIAVVTFSLIVPPLADKKSIGRRRMVICASVTH